MKSNFLRIFSSLVILFLLLPSSSIQARQTIASTDAPEQEVVSDVDSTLPEGLSRSEWQSIQNQIMSNLSQQAYLKASNTDAIDRFGWSIAISGDTIVVGAYFEDSSATGINGNQSDNSANDSGAAYVFVRNGSNWTQQAYLKASNSNAYDEFGSSVAISGDTIVVGAWKEASAAAGVNGNQSDNSASKAGAAYVFVRSGSNWIQQAYLKASNTNEGDRFGNSVAISGDTIIVGAYCESSNATGINGDQSDNSAYWAGAAYVFNRSGSNWSQQAYLKASNTDSIDGFGMSVSISGNTIVIGAYAESSNAVGVNGNQSDNSASAAGAAYVFVRSDTTWSQQAYLKASNTDSGDAFGESVAISVDTIVVGAWHEDSNSTGVNGNQSDNNAQNAGAAYVFVRSGTAWTQQAYLKASNTDDYDGFGRPVAIYSDTIVVLTCQEDSNATGIDGNQYDNSASFAGAGYVFTREGATWTQQAYIKASNTDAGDLFGWSAAISGNTIVIGASDEGSNSTGVNGDQYDNSASMAGAAYVFVGEPTVPPIDPSWLLMYYFAGDNDSSMDNDLLAEHTWVVENYLQPYVDVAVFHDSKSKGTSYSYYPSSGSEETIDKGNLNSGDGQTLSDFIVWAKQKSSAPNIALVIADHGHGLSGVAWDKRDNPDHIKVNDELRNALIASGPVDVIYSHTCLTANLEFMWELRDYTNYYVASESSGYATPHDYVNLISENTTPQELAESIADSYYNKWHSEKSSSSISVVDMTYIYDMFVRTNNLALAIKQAPRTTKESLWDLLDASILQRFDGGFPDGIDNFDRLGDLFQFASLVNEYPELSTAAQSLLELEDEFVVYDKAWSGTPHNEDYYWDHEKARGVSIALPRNPISFYIGDWLEFASGADWSFVNSGVQSSIAIDGFNWGPMVSDLVLINNPAGEDEPLPPDLLPLLGFDKIFLPSIHR